MKKSDKTTAVSALKAENEIKEKAVHRLMSEIQKGWDSAEKEGWLDIDDVEAQLKIVNRRT